MHLVMGSFRTGSSSVPRSALLLRDDGNPDVPPPPPGDGVDLGDAVEFEGTADRTCLS